MFQVRIELTDLGGRFQFGRQSSYLHFFPDFPKDTSLSVNEKSSSLPDVNDILFDDEPCKWYIGVSAQTKVVKCNYFDSIHKKSKFTEAESKESCWLLQFGRQTSYLHFSPDLPEDKSFSVNKKSSGGSRIFCWM